MGGRTGRKAVATRGNIGQQVFAEVERLTAAGAMNRLAAFKQLASTSGRQVGTVAANYYRVARSQGAPLRPRKRRGAVGVGRGTGRILKALRAIEGLLQEQEVEMVRLREENAQFAKLRRILG